MKRIQLSSQTSPHFIGSWNIHNDELCENIINFFKNNSVLQKKKALQLEILLTKM